MKKGIFAAVIGIITLTSCAQKKQQREEEKSELNAEHMRNRGVDSAASSGNTMSPGTEANNSTLKADTADAK